MQFELVTDSSCNLTEEMIEDFGLHILPLTFMADGDDKIYQSYLKGSHVDLGEFYAMMREGKVFRTSLPNLAESEALIRSLLEAGRDVLYVGFSSGLSGTYEATSLLMKDLAKEFPERKLYAVDTLGASGGEGLLIWHAVQKARAGAPIEEVHAWLEENKLHLAHWFTVDDLMFLYRGGRVSRTAAFAGSLLNIKPVLHVDDEGRLIPVEKTRGRMKSIRRLFEHFKETFTEPLSDQTLAISHGDCIEDALTLKKMIEDEYGPQKFIINYVDPVIGAHSGPGTLAFFFMGSHR